MKNVFFIFFITIFTINSFAQAPESFKYQAVVRNSNGEIISEQTVSFKISILQGSTNGTSVYTETHQPETNAFGLVNLIVGNGNIISGDLSIIDWSNGPYFLQIEMDATGGTNYQIMGATQLLSVPFALYSKNTENIDDADADPVNEIQTLNVSGNVLSISNGNNVIIPSFDDADADPNNEFQTLDISGNTLSISSGNNVTIPSFDDADADPNNEFQNLSIMGDSLKISNGNGVQLPIGSSIWTSNGSDISFNNGNVGIGSTEPTTRLEVHANASSSPDEPIFKVINTNGDTVFAVYPEGVRINIGNGTTKGTRGGFAVGGLSSTGKLGQQEYLRVTTDSVRIYIDTSSAKGTKGGFAVSGLSSTGKTLSHEYLRVTRDSTRIYVNQNTTKGNKGGFAVSGLSSGKDETSNFLDLTVENYLIGHEAGKNITTGLYNSFFGYQSGLSDTSGSSNIFMGYQSGYSNLDGFANVFVGKEAGLQNTAGKLNVFIGEQSGKSNTTGYRNLFLGPYAGYSNTEGRLNISIGAVAGIYNTTGERNVFIGQGAGYSNDTSSYNIFIGDNSGAYSINGEQNVFLGYKAGYQNKGSRNVFLGTNAGLENQNGNDNIFAGTYSGYNNTTGYSNVFLGVNVGKNNSSGYENVIIGTYAGMSNTTGMRNVFIGQGSGGAITEGSHNIFMGDLSGYFCSGGDNNIFLGTNSGFNNESGNSNIFIGESAGSSNTTGSENIFMGKYTGHSNTTGYGNTFLGNYAGYNCIEGVHNVFIGRAAGYNELNSERLVIENTNADENGALIYGEFDSDYLRFNARVGIGTRAESDANLFIKDTTGLASIKIRGTGDSYNFSRIVLESNEAINKFWQLAYKKNNDYTVVFNNGTTFLSRFKIYADGGAKIYYGGLEVDSTITANKIKSNGGFSTRLNSITENYTVTGNDYTILVATSSSDITISLPIASSVANQIFIIKKTDSNANNINITCSGSETIDGLNSQSLTSQYMAYTIQSDGSNWYIIGKVN